MDGDTPTDFWPVEIIGDHATKLAEYLTKGRLVLVAGSGHIDERRDGGQYRVFPYINARQVRFLDRRERMAVEEQQGQGAEPVSRGKDC